MEKSGYFAKETARNFRAEPETKSTAISLKGKGEWAIDSGNSFAIDLDKDRPRMYSLMSPVAMRTADGEDSADKGIMMRLSGDAVDVECYIFPNFPSLLSLAKLCLEADFSFSWPRGEKP